MMETIDGDHHGYLFEDRYERVVIEEIRMSAKGDFGVGLINCIVLAIF